MSPELIGLAVLTAPGGIVGAIGIAGHLLARRHDAAVAAVFAPEPETTPPTGDGEPLPEPVALADVIPFPARHRTTDTGNERHKAA